MNTKWKSFIFALSLASLALVVFPVAAKLEAPDCTNLGIACPPAASGSPSAANTAQFVTTTLTDIINILLGFVSLIAGIFVVWGGAQYITSAGNETKAENGKKTVLYAVAGLLIIGISAIVVNFVISLFA